MRPTRRTIGLAILVMRIGPLRRWIMARMRSRASQRAVERVAPTIQATWQALPPAWIRALESSGFQLPQVIAEQRPGRDRRPVLMAIGVALVAAIGAAAIITVVRSRRPAAGKQKAADSSKRVAVPVYSSEPSEPPSSDGRVAVERAEASVALGAERDELRAIRGIGPTTAERLRRAGVDSVGQIAGWTSDDIRRVAREVGLSVERIEHEDWVGQARTLHGSVATPE